MKASGGRAGRERAKLRFEIRWSTVAEGLLPPLLGFGLTFAIVGAMMLMIGVSPLTAFGALFSGALGSLYAFGLTLVCSAPVILAGLSVCFAFRAGLFNIGGEGQLQIGALFAFVAGLTTGNYPLSVLAAFIGGAVWGGVAGILKVWRNVSEIISTIMLNFVAIYILKDVVLGPLGDPGASYPTSVRLSQTAWAPVVIPGTNVHVGFFIALMACVLAYLFFKHAPLGFSIRAVGESPDAARHAGINANVCRLLALLVAGGLAGLAGGGELLGLQHRLGFEWSLGWGFTGLAVSFLARNHPLGIIPVGLFFGVLDAGSYHMQAVTGVPAAMVKLVQGMPVVFLIAVISWQSIRARHRVSREAVTVVER